MATNPNDIAYQEKGVGVTTLESIEEAIRYNLWICSRITPWLGEANLELGAGTGTISNILRKEHQLDLTEVSADCRELLKTRFKDEKNIKVLDVDYFNVEGPYDCIYSSNVLEHVEDDYSYIVQAQKLLKPNGHFVAVVPGHNFLMSHFDRQIGHFRRYDQARIRAFKERLAKDGVNLRLVGSRHYNPVGALGWFVKMKLLKRKHIKYADVKTMEILVPFLSKLDSFDFGLGQNFVFVFQKG